MSHDREIDYHCPHCHARNRAKLPLRIDAVDEPGLVAKLLDGTLFDLPCAACQESSPLDHSLVYIDALAHYAVLNAPKADPLASELTPPDLPKGFTLRRVEDMNALRELVNARRTGLDDVAMLLLKHMVAARILQDRGAAPVVCAFEEREAHDGREWLTFLVFQTEVAEPETLSAPFSMYEDLLRLVERHRDAVMPTDEWIDWNDETAKRVWEELRG